MAMFCSKRSAVPLFVTAQTKYFEPINSTHLVCRPS